MGGVEAIEVEVAPAAIDVFDFEKAHDLLGGEKFEARLLGGIVFSIFVKSGKHAKSISMAPDVVGRGGVDVSEFG